MIKKLAPIKVIEWKKNKSRWDFISAERADLLKTCLFENSEYDLNLNYFFVQLQHHSTSVSHQLFQMLGLDYEMVTFMLEM